MSEMPKCPECSSEYVYQDQLLYVCPECAYEWSSVSVEEEEPVEAVKKYFDAHGTELNDGDDVIVIKDLKLRGSSDVIKQGTKVRNIKLKDTGDHDIDCRVDGIGPMELKTEFVKKA